MIDTINLLSKRTDKKLTDVLVGGYIDEDKGIKYFHPMFEHVFFNINGIFLKMSSINQYWNLEIKVVNGIHCDFSIDEDDEFCVGSIQHLVLSNPNRSFVHFGDINLSLSKEIGIETKVGDSFCLCMGASEYSDMGACKPRRNC